MRLFILFLLMLSLTSSLSAEHYPLGKAVLFSALIPGTGELYTRQYTKAGIFLCAELTIILSYFRLHQETNWAIRSYEQYAYTKAGVSLHSPENLYQLIQNYFNSDIYNQGVELYARNRYLIWDYNPQAYQEYLDMYLIGEDQAWDWQTENYWNKYRDMRSDKQDLEIYTKFTFAAAILNRLISIIDTLISTRKINRSEEYYGKLSIQPDWIKRGMVINYEYRF
ncbi:MAG: hypothetical protein JXB60_01865 [Candidatus Cloacimonetes bacterium]|nr:hypothetical protein [Candidatus Cloacimonadota bacterium]